MTPKLRAVRRVLPVLALALLGSAPDAVSRAHAQERLDQLDDATLVGQVEAALLGADSPQGTLPIKCLVPHFVEMEARGFDLQALPLARSAAELLYFETADGHFRIEYAISGLDSVDVADADLSGVPDYVEWVGEAMTESWVYEVEQFGFPAIPLGPGERYRVQIKRAPGFYGYTNYRNVTDPGGSNIVINSDFAAFYRTYPSLVNDDPDGLVRGAIRVTAAHEFKHALQIAAGWNVGETPLWVEVDATAMEDIVYDQVNDYYNYIRQAGSPFISPLTSLLEATYNDATWHLFLVEKYGMHLLTDFDAYRAAQPLTIAPTAYRAVAEQNGLVWKELWREYAAWNFLTGTRTTPTRGFGEAAFYPTAPTQSIPTVPLGPTNFTLAPWANRFHMFNNGSRTASGGVRVTFDGDHENWGVSVVLQNAQQTVVVPLPVTLGPDTLEIRTHDVKDFDRIAIVVGNARVASHSFIQDTYSLFVEFDASLPVAPASSFGSFKRNFGRGSDQ